MYMLLTGKKISAKKAQSYTTRKFCDRKKYFNKKIDSYFKKIN